MPRAYLIFKRQCIFVSQQGKNYAAFLTKLICNYSVNQIIDFSGLSFRWWKTSMQQVAFLNMQHHHDIVSHWQKLILIMIHKVNVNLFIFVFFFFPKTICPSDGLCVPGSIWFFDEFVHNLKYLNPYFLFACNLFVKQNF